MTTYTIKPIEWREGKAFVNEVLVGMYIKYSNGEIFSRFNLINEQSKPFATIDEAKSFIETSYKEFIEQFLEKQ